MAAVISTIYNSIKRIEAESKSLSATEGLPQLCSSRGLASQLLLAAAPTTLKLQVTEPSNNSSSSSTDSPPPPPSDPVLEWLHILFFHILKSKNNSLLRMFLTLKPRAVGESVWDFDITALDSLSNVVSDGAEIGAERALNERALNKGEEGGTLDRAVLTHEQVSSCS